MNLLKQTNAKKETIVKYVKVLTDLHNMLQLTSKLSMNTFCIKNQISKNIPNSLKEIGILKKGKLKSWYWVGRKPNEKMAINLIKNLSLQNPVRKKTIKPLKVNDTDNLKSKIKASKALKNNTFGNSNGVKKQEARKLMANAIKVQGKIPSLPFSTCELEKMILDKNPKGFTFIGCERDSKTYDEMCKTIMNDEVLKTAISTHYGLIGDVLFDAKEDAFSNLILDYCGVLESFIKEIEHVVENNIVGKGGAICITLNKRGYNGDSVKNRILSKIPVGIYGNTCGEVELATIIYFHNLVLKNIGYSIEEFFNYQDTAPMMLIILRRNK